MSGAIRWEKLSPSQKSAWLDVLGALADSRKLPRHAEAAFDRALDYDGRLPGPVARGVKRAIIAAREILGLP